MLGRPQSTRVSVLLAIPIAIGLIAVLPAIVALANEPSVKDDVYWLQVALTCYAGARLAMMILGGRQRVIQGSFWLFCYVALGIAPLAQLVLEQVPTPVLGTREQHQLALFLLLAGFFAFDLGAAFARLRGQNPTPRPQRPPWVISRRGLGVLVLLALAGGAFYIIELGGPQVFFSTRQELTEGVEAWAQSDSQAFSAMLRGFGTVPPLLALLFTIRWLMTSRTARHLALPWLLLAVLLGLNVIVNNPITNPRFWFVAAMLALLFTLFSRSQAIYRAILVAGVAAALLIFPYADMFRYEGSSPHTVESSAVLDPLTRKDYDQVGMFANTIGYVHDGNGHTMGGQVAGAALFFVPRSIWADKPVDSPVLVGEWMGTNNVNLSAPLWAELWLDFGEWGMLAGLALLGYAASAADRRYSDQTAARGSAGSVAAVLAPVAAGYAFILLRGGMLQAVGRIGVMLACVAVVLLVSSRHQRQLD